MARQRDPRRDQAFEIWKEHKGEITNRAIAKMLNLPEKTIGGWKSKDNWRDKASGILQKRERSIPIKNKKYSKTINTRKEKAPKCNEKDKGFELSHRHQRFVDEFLIDFNGTQAAIRAGYEENSARVTASRLLTKTNIREKIAEGMKELQKRIRHDSTAAYFVLWNQVYEIDKQLTDHEEAAQKLKELEAEYLGAMVNGDEDKAMRLRLEIPIYSRRVMKTGDWVKSQALRTSILQDILDRGGFKPFDLLESDPAKLQLALNKDRREDEKFQLEKRIVELREREEKMKGW